MPDIAIAHSKKTDRSDLKSASSKSEKKLKDAKPKSEKVKSDKPKEKKDKKRSNDDSSDSAKDEKKKKSSAKKIKTDSTSEPAATTGSATTNAVAREFYEKHNISVTGDDSFMPYLDFTQTPFNSDILKACAKFAKPTPIQSACWPVVTAARDVIGIAETGSGKTYAFALPAIHWLSKVHGDRAKKCKKPLVLIVSPTRELAIQTHEQCLEAGKALGITSVCLYGGSSKSQQGAELRQAKPAIIVATPGRLIDVVENDQTLDLSEVGFLVLDEADRMLDQGFENDIRKIIHMLRQGDDRQTVMFSATWPKSVRALADTFLRNPVRVSIGSDELAINERVEQIVEVVDRFQKDKRLKDLLMQYHRTRKNRVLVFVLYKKEASRVEEMLKRTGYNCVAIHGDKQQNQRIDAIESFRSGKIPLLIATDVAARGLDVPDVEYVINYTFPLTIDEYTHRCGRTARAGKSGIAHTFFSEEDKSHSGELINVLKSAKMPVPDNLLKFGTTVKKKQHGSYGAFYKDVDPNVKATKIVFD
ncbi:RNA-dependent ATPase [Coemansia aciculifera]|uniref:RNA helicase n=1 Tax=Coemansia aciculifera TaxID=417176 RepID=A0A9W8IC13_9FUNG|nr:RNA-dependent ATPase [Coemansia aciculifera]KAJ2868933.1 RNA-dependent ATPase [Coemansia aciculifera]